MQEGKSTGMESNEPKPLLQALAGKTVSPPPWWLMRQAGRYLPEYRNTRAKAQDFVGFCLTPELAAEATLQPVRRFGMDGAILFSDILLMPYALGQRLAFREGEGPVLDPVFDNAGIARLERGRVVSRLEPVFEAVRRVRAALGPKTALIGFAGSPWTVAAYMVEGGSSRDFQRVKGWAYRDPIGFGVLIDALVESTIELLGGPDRGGCRDHPAFRQLGGRPVRSRVRALGDRADKAHHGIVENPVSRLSADRLSPWRGSSLRELCEEDGCRCGGARHVGSGRLCAVSSTTNHGRAREPRPGAADCRRRGTRNRGQEPPRGARKRTLGLQSRPRSAAANAARERGGVGAIAGRAGGFRVGCGA